jgi:hypothetical protein
MKPAETEPVNDFVPFILETKNLQRGLIKIMLTFQIENYIPEFHFSFYLPFPAEKIVLL